MGEPVNGILLLDKPVGITSNKALQLARRLLNARKGGHTGSLDPIATGVLPLCFGQATRISGLLLESSKQYEVGIRLGVATDSGDWSGTVLSRKPVEYDAAALDKALSRFRGEIRQTPPMFSALKQNGQRLYELARKGLEVQREPRVVTVHNLSIQRVEGDYLELQVHCSRGFYIRSLAMDLGNELNCGGHVECLRRTAVHEFRIDQCVDLERLEALQSADSRRDLLVPVDQALEGLPKIELSEYDAVAFCQGQSVSCSQPSGDYSDRGLVRLYSANNRFLGIGQMTAGKIAPRKVFA